MDLTNYDYTVGWISALPVEMAPAKAMMDTLHSPLPQVPQDTNIYTLGRIGTHNVVLVCLPSVGTNAAAHAAANLLRSFPNVRFGLMVGIGGGVPGPPNPNSTKDIRLGDIVVGNPEDLHGSVIQYDFGIATQNGSSRGFVRKGYLNKPPKVLLGAVRNIQADAMMQPTSFHRHYDEMLEKYPTMITEYHRPEGDRLYTSKYTHKGKRPDCTECSDEKLVNRQPRDVTIVHYGLIGSANQVLKNAILRDKLHAKEDIICFEMEAAGLMDEFSCIVIRGICDYCDSHESKQWQPYSSAIAASFGKELFLKIPPTAVEKLPQLENLAVVNTNAVNNDPNRVELLRTQTEQGNRRNPISLEKHKKCLDTLKCIHPRFDKARLEDTKGGLLRDAYKWILDTKEYNAWLSGHELLWIKGDPGKGKTMLMCGIIEELDKNAAYFFCQATIDTKNTATQVLRGLIFAILEESPFLSEDVHDRIERASNLPEESAFYILKEVIEHLLATHEMTLMIDALDECSIGLDVLLRFIIKASVSYSSRWLVTSRNIPEIIEALEETSQLSLELNEHSVTGAVNFFINYKVQVLTRVKKYDETLRASILNYLMDNAKGTFLWVSLVCLNLSTVRLHQTKIVLSEYPPGLEALYRRMLDSIEASADAHKLKQILAIMCTVFRPVLLDELDTMIESVDEEYSVSWIEDMVNDCRSFLTIRNSVVQFVHQSAKDFLMLKEAKSTFPDGKLAVHRHVFSSSLQCLQYLSRNMYGLKEPGATIDSIEVPTPDPLAKMRYASIYWVDHLVQITDLSSEPFLSLTDTDLISNFFKTKSLYWFEALSLLQNVYPSLLAITKLVTHIKSLMLQTDMAVKRSGTMEVLDLISDVLQCLRYFQYALIRFPLQVYISVLLFSPTQSLIKRYFSHEMPRWVILRKGLRETWPVNLSLDVRLVWNSKWSPDGQRLATYCFRGYLRVWDTASGQLLSEICDQDIQDFVFAKDSKTLRLTCGSCPSIRSCLAINGQVRETVPLKGQESTSISTYKTVFSQDATLVACARHDQTIYVHRTDLGAIVKTLRYENPVHFLIFSPDNLYLASINEDVVEVWNIQSGSIMWHIESEGAYTMAFSPCSKLLAIARTASFDLWQWQDCRKLYALDNSSLPGWVKHSGLAFHPEHPFIFVSNGPILQEWSNERPTMRRICGSFGGRIIATSVSGDGQNFAASDEDTVKIWHIDDHSSEFKEDIVSNSGFEDLRLTSNTIYGIANNTTTEIHKWSIKSEYSQSSVICLKIRADGWIISQDCSKAAFYQRQSGIIETWDLDHSHNLGRIQEYSTGDYPICWGPDVGQLTVCSYEISSVVLYQIQTSQIIDKWAYPINLTSDLRSTHTRWSNQGRFFVMGHKNGLYLWDNQCRNWATLCAKNDYGWHLWNQSKLQFSPNGSLLLALSVGRELHVFRTDSQVMVLNIPDHGNSFCWTIDEKWLRTDKAYYTSSEGSLVPNKTIIRYPAVHLNMETEFSKDRSWIRSGSDNIIWLPQDFRSPIHSWDIVNSTVVMLLAGGHLMILDIDWDRPKDLGTQDQETGIEASSKRKRSSPVPISKRLKSS